MFGKKFNFLDDGINKVISLFDFQNLLLGSLIKKFKDGTFDKENLPIFFELIEEITDDKKLTIPWEKL